MIYIYITFTSYLVATMLIFFFLRGTSPTDIYTLSLHDALPIFILTTFDDDELVLEGLRAGARGYLLKDVTLEELLNAVRTVAEGKTLVRVGITERLMQGLGKMQTEFDSLEQPDPLTDRETEILRLMAGGYSNKEIAAALNVAEGTVKNHVSSVLSKMGVRDRTRAVLKALENGLI